MDGRFVADYADTLADTSLPDGTLQHQESRADSVYVAGNWDNNAATPDGHRLDGVTTTLYKGTAAAPRFYIHGIDGALTTLTADVTTSTDYGLDPTLTLP